MTREERTMHAARFLAALVTGMSIEAQRQTEWRRRIASFAVALTEDLDAALDAFELEQPLTGLEDAAVEAMLCRRCKRSPHDDDPSGLCCDCRKQMNLWGAGASSSSALEPSGRQAGAPAPVSSSSSRRRRPRKVPLGGA